MQPEKDRCWLTHRKREDWSVCPRCGKPLIWRRNGDEWTPCDTEPKLCVTGGRWRINKNRELTEAEYRLWKPGYKEKPIYAMIPHYYTCTPLRDARREFARRMDRCRTGS